MRNISLIVKRVLKSAFVFAVLSVLTISATRAQDVVEGRKLFKENCSSCHQLGSNSIGPALTPMLKELDEAFAIKWIRNWKALVDAGDKQAIEASKYSPAEMPLFPRLTDVQIKNIIAYAKAGEPKKAAEAGAATETTPEGASTFSIAGIVGIILLSIFVLVILGRAVKMLERLILQKQGVVIVDDVKVPFGAGFKVLFKNKKFVGFVVLLLVISLGSFGWMGMWNTGVHTGYQPSQPIKFSHELHAGTNQIDCQYCHQGAFKSKNSTIPSMNVCMNCHKAVQATEKYDGQISPEIQKIYAALGYNPETQTYDKSKEKPVEWVRVHNLPDFAYFNHSQHVVVGEAAIRKEKGLKPNEPVCFACHGPVNTMEEIYQYSPLTMKWCINCHRNAELDVKGNAFYDKIIEAHDKIKKGEKITPAALGGLECGKCHY
ncbi:c-type cytochrome [Pedobacter sp. JCM 36344]|uniref:c-type cytochrome n=1 Tax=Pedobacter sp. JCM 36344 TaxID=3374280 RepID=UPI003977EC19